jgi:hypothetical protein
VRALVLALALGVLLAGCTSLDPRISRADVNDSTDAPAADVTTPDATDTAPAPDVAAPVADAAPAPDPSAEPAPEPSVEPAPPEEHATAPPDENATVPTNDTTPPPPAAPAPLAFTLGPIASSTDLVEAGSPGALVSGVASGPGASGIVAFEVRGALAGSEDIILDQTPEGCSAQPAPEGGLSFACRFYAPRGADAGVYAVVVEARGADGGVADSRPIDVEVAPVTEITIGAPADASGNVSSIPVWGGWAARPGATGVSAANYFRILNTGDDPATRAVIDLGTQGFVGQYDARFVIPTQNNVEFAWFEVPPGAAPAGHVLAWHNGTGAASDTLAFTQKGGVIYVAYRIAQMPSILPAQPYVASVTVTEV